MGTCRFNAFWVWGVCLFVCLRVRLYLGQDEDFSQGDISTNLEKTALRRRGGSQDVGDRGFSRFNLSRLRCCRSPQVGWVTRVERVG